MDTYADQRILRRTAATLSWQNVDAAGEAAAPEGTVTVGIVDAAGTTIVAAGTATSGTGTAPRTVAVTAANTANLGRWTVTWTDDGDSSTHTTVVEVVGCHVFSITEARDRTAPRLDDTSKWPTARLDQARLELTEELEWITDRSFCRRSERLTVDGTGERGLYLPRNDLVEVTAVTVDGTAYTAAQLAALLVDEDRWVYRPEGSVWPSGRRNIVITYTYGLERPPHQVKGAAMHRLADMVNRTKTNLPDRATHLTNEQGTIQLARAGTYRTGNAEVDAVYQRYSKRRVTEGESGDGGGPAAASMSLQFDPTYDSLYHGGRR